MTGQHLTLHIGGVCPVTAEHLTMSDGTRRVEIVIGTLVLVVPPELADEIADAIIADQIEEPVNLRPVVDTAGVY